MRNDRSVVHVGSESAKLSGLKRVAFISKPEIRSQQRRHRKAILLACTALVMPTILGISATPALAQSAGQLTQFWDGADMTGNGSVDGGTHVWNSTNTNWADAADATGINGIWGGQVGVFTGTPGTVTVSGPLAFEGLQFSTSGYQITGDALTLSGDSAGNTDASFVNVDSAVSATISSRLQGSGIGLDKQGAGTLILTGNNTYTGGTTISGGVLQIGDGGTAGSIVGDVASEGTLVFNRSNNISFAGDISGLGGVVKLGGGRLSLSGDSGYSGGTYLQEGTLRVESSTALGTGLVAAEDAIIDYKSGIDIGNTIIIYDTGLELKVSSGSATQSGMIIEAGGDLATLTKTGTGTLVVKQVHNSGDTEVSAGTWKAGADFAFSSSSAHVVSSGAKLDIGGYDQTIDALSGAGTVINSGASERVLQIGTVGFTSSSTEFSGTIKDGPGGLGLYLQSSGIFTLSGNNTYTGDTLICDCSTLQIGNGGTSGVVAGNIINNGVLIFNRSNIYTFGHMISDGLGSPGEVVQTGTGTTIFTGDNTYTGGTTINAGVLQIGAGGAGGSILGDVVVRRNGQLVVDRSRTFAFDGGISGAGSFEQKGQGITIFGDGITYSGTTTISAGTLQIGTGFDEGSISTGDILNNGKLSVDKSAALTIAGDINGLGTFTTTGGVWGTGITTLSGDNNYGGTTSVLGGTLKAGSSGAFSDNSAFVLSAGALLDLDGRSQAIGSLFGRGNVDLGFGSLTTGGNDRSTTFSGGMVGSGGLNKTGEGTFTLSGAGTYTGATRVQEGILQAGAANAFSAGSALTVAGGATLKLNGFDQTVASVAGAGDILLGDGTLTSGGNNTSTSVSGEITGTGGMIKAGTGVLTLRGDNDYSGATTVSAGTLRAGSAGGFSDDSAFIVNSGAVLDLGTASQSIGSLAGSGTVALGTRNLTLGSDDTSTVYLGRITGTGGIAKAGAGTLTLGGASVYTGSTTINEGTLLAGTNGHFAAVSAFRVNSGAVLDLGSSDQEIGSITGAGGIVLGNGTLTTGGNQKSTTFTGTISGRGGIEKTGAGKFVLTGNSTYTGDTAIDRGTLQVDGKLGDTDVTVKSGATLSGSGSIAGKVSVGDGGHLAPGSGSTGTMTLGSLVLADGATLDYQLGATSDRIDVTGDLTLDGTLNVTRTQNFGAGVYRLFNYGGRLIDRGLELGSVPSGFGPGDLTIQSDIARQINLINSQNVVLSFWDGGNRAQYNNGKVDGGSGTWTATGGAWTGSDGAFNSRIKPQPGFAVFQGTAGVVTVDDAKGEVAVSGMQFATNGYRVQGDAIRLASTNTVIRVGDGRQSGAAYQAAIGSTLTGSGRLVKEDLGTLVLTGANSYTGGTLINAGTLSVSSNSNLGNSKGGLAFDGGTLRNTSAFATSRSVALLSNGGTFRADANLIASGVISGSGNLGKSGTGTLTLTNTNTYTGGTTIGAGTLQIGNGGTTGAITGNVTNNGALAFNRSDMITFGGKISGSGVVQQNGKGTTVLTGNNTHIGGTIVNTGTLQLGNGGTTGSVAGNIALKGAIAINRSNAMLLAGKISGSGSLRQIGTGTTVLAGANTYTGGTTISAGTLQIGNGGTVGSITGDVIDNGVLAFNRSSTMTFGGRISGSGAVEQRGSGTTVLTGTNTYTGGTAIKAGRLQFGNGGTAGSITGDVIDNGVLAFNRSDMVTFGDRISGSGAVEQMGTGTTVLTGTNTYTGGTAIKAGRLQIGNGGTAGSITGNVVDNGILAFNRSNTLTFSGNIAGSGAVHQDGSGTTVLTGKNTYTGGTTITAGTLKGDTSSFGAGKILNDSTFVMDQNIDAIFANVVDGAGTFTKTGSGTLTLTGNSGLSGNTIVKAGRLSINGSIANSTISVLDGGNIGGTGTIGSLTVRKGGVLAPGNSIGTLNVKGDLNVSAGSRLEIETTAKGDSDKIAVSGAAKLSGGTVHLIAGAGTYSPTTAFNFLTATGGVTGRFETLTTDLAFLTPDFIYGSKGVSIGFDRNDVSLSSVGKTQNQRATAHALDKVGAGNAAFDKVVGLDKPGARRAFDALSGEMHASVQGVLVDDSRFVRDAANMRIRAAFGDGLAASQPVTVYGEGGLSTAEATTDRLAIWGQAFGAWGRTDGDGGMAALTRSVGGFLGGADVAVFDNWRLGLIGGYGQTSFDVSGRSSSGDSDDYHIGVYGGGRWGDFGLSAVASYSRHDIDTKRSVAFGGFSENLTADYTAHTVQVFGEAGYQIHAGPVTFEPFANLAYVNLRTDGFSEKGGAAALSADDSDMNTTFTTLGARTSASFAIDGIEATARGMLGWRHAFGNVTPSSSLAFGGGSAFTVLGVPIARDSAIVEAGLDFALSPAAKLGVSYVGQFADGLTEQGFKANLDVKF